ncbi:MAG: TetR/AcrR family transcriptional regulator [Pseudomonadota bacterium]
MSDAATHTPTPAERRRHRVRQTILDAAERVFAEDGEAGLSIRRLADEIDYSPGAIYKYFESKQELVDELKEAFFARILDRVEDLPDDPDRFLLYARKCMTTYIHTALDRPHHYAAAFSGEVNMTNTPLNLSPFSNRMKAFGILQAMVNGGVTLGIFRADLDVDLAAKSLWASCHGVALLMTHMPDLPLAFVGRPDVSQTEFIEAHADLIVRGLLA